MATTRKIGGGTTTDAGAFAVAELIPSGALALTGFAPIAETRTPGGVTVVKDSIAPGTLKLTGFAPIARRMVPLALDTYTNIIAALMKQTHQDVTACVDDLFRQGELRIFRRLRLRTMETKLSVMASVGGAPVPSDFIELRWAHTLLNGDAMELESQTGEWIYRWYSNRNAEARPRYIGRDGDNFIFGPAPDSNYLLNGNYYRRLQSLASTSTSWFTTNAADLLMAAGKIEIYNFTEDFESAGIWEQRFELLASRVEQEERREHRGGGPRRQIPDMAYR